MTKLKNIIPIRQWYPGLKNSPLLIAGPCSAENEEQVMQTALAIAKQKKVNVFR